MLSLPSGKAIIDEALIVGASQQSAEYDRNVGELLLYLQCDEQFHVLRLSYLIHTPEEYKIFQEDVEVVWKLLKDEDE